MIQLFKKIRHSLLSEGKTARYIKYALGEIILVIVGILIALSINNWNEGRKIKSSEQDLLKDLQIEVSDNIAALERVIAEHEKSHAAAIRIQELINDREAFANMSEDSFRDLFNEMDTNWTYDPNNGILNSIISSGQIKDISNKELKYLLASVKDRTTDAFEETMKIEGWRNDLWTGMIEHLFTYQEGKITGASFKNLYDIPEFRLYRSLFDGIREDGLEEEREFKKTMDHILSLIESEITE